LLTLALGIRAGPGVIFAFSNVVFEPGIHRQWLTWNSLIALNFEFLLAFRWNPDPLEGGQGFFVFGFTVFKGSGFKMTGICEFYS
jgi:hypothetical protein